MRLVDSFNVSTTVVIDRPEDPSEEYDLHGSFADVLNVLIGPYFGSAFCVPLGSYFDVIHVIHLPTLISDRLLSSNTITGAVILLCTMLVLCS